MIFIVRHMHRVPNDERGLQNTWYCTECGEDAPGHLSEYKVWGTLIGLCREASKTGIRLPVHIWGSSLRNRLVMVYSYGHISEKKHQ